MLNTKLGKKQEEILEFLRDRVATLGPCPSLREIGEAVKLSSSSTVHSHLVTLVRKGYMKRDAHRPRSFVLTDPPKIKGAATSLLARWATLGDNCTLYSQEQSEIEAMQQLLNETKALLELI